jgi:PAS domain S-box-containing protein
VTFDIRTAILGLAVGNLALSLILYLFQFGAKNPQRIPFLTIGKLMQGIGWLLLYGRDFIPDILSFTLGNIILICGTAYEGWAMYRISQLKVSREMRNFSMAGIVVVCIAATFLSAAGRVAVTSFAVMVFFAIGGRAILSDSSGNPLLRRHIGWGFWLMATVLFTRGTWAAIAPEYFTLFATNTIQLIMFASLYYLMLANGFGMLLLAKEITDRELAASDELFRSYFELPLIGIAITSPSKGWLAVNQKNCDMFGYSQAELMTMTWTELTYPADLAMDVAQFERVLAGEIDGYHMEKRFVRKDGQVFYAHLAVQCVRHPDQSVNYMVALIEDISARKQAETALEESEARYHDLYENAPDMYLSIEVPTGKILNCNQTITRMTGFEKQSLIGRNVVDLYHPECLGAARQAMQSLLTTGLVTNAEMQICCLDGTWIDVSLNASAIRDLSGQVVRSRSIWRNITDRKKAEQEVRQLNAELEQRVLERTADLKSTNTALEKALRAREDFLAIMSHELRTPMNGILGLTYLMQLKSYGELNAKQTNAIQNIEKSGGQLMVLINAVLDYSSLLADKLVLQVEPCAMESLCQDCLKTAKSLADKKHQELSFTLRPETLNLRADRRRLSQIIDNLLSNAIKFTPEGGRIDLSVTGHPEAGQALISVTDTGIGIQEADLPRVFEPFHQLDMRLQRIYDGSGLGLSLVEKLVAMHGGSVEVKSTPGQGSQFTVTLPWDG